MSTATPVPKRRRSSLAALIAALSIAAAIAPSAASASEGNIYLECGIDGKWHRVAAYSEAASCTYGDKTYSEGAIIIVS